VAELSGRARDGRAPIFKRVVLKLGGEALLGEAAYGIDHDAAQRIAQQLRHVHERGVQVAIVVGGGNIVRGQEASAHGIDRVTGDYMGMLATVINALALRDAIEHLDMECRVQSAIAMQQVAEPFIPRRAVRHLEKGRVVILAAGTGNPFFTTDTTAVLRAAEIGAQAVLKATNVDGVYSADPKKDASAKRFDRLTHSQAIEGGYKVMDATAFALARETSLPIIVFSIADPGSIGAILRGTGHGTIVAG
jgi:uridylate kinase